MLGKQAVGGQAGAAAVPIRPLWLLCVRASSALAPACLAHPLCPHRMQASGCLPTWLLTLLPTDLTHTAVVTRVHPTITTTTHPPIVCTGVGGAREPDPVEYDLDNEDEDWLKGYNLGRNKLSDQLFEKMLWKLELACAEATDSALTAAGAGWMGGCREWGVCVWRGEGWGVRGV